MGRRADPARAAAIEAGEKTFEGKPCERGHTTRHTLSRACVQCQADAQRQRRGTIAPRVRASALDELLG